MKLNRVVCALWLALPFAPPLFAAPTPVTLSTVASTNFVSYVAGLETMSPCIVMVHDWFGVSPSYIESADRLARQGYCVVAVDLYNGKTAETHEEASALLGTLDGNLASEKIDAAIKLAGDRHRTVAIMGFSMGVKHALAAALRNRSVRATVLWYGETPRDPNQVRALNGPVLLIDGSKDGSSALEDTLAFAKAADVAGAGAEIYIYPGAAHAFAQPLFNQGKTYDPVAAQAAWRLTEDFLNRRLR